MFRLCMVCAGLATVSVVLAQPVAPVKRGSGEQVPRALAVQILLDRAGFSPGQIDGRVGQNTKNALAVFQTARGLPETGQADATTLKALSGSSATELLSDYTIAAEDTDGPFAERIPDDMMEKAKLPALAYASALEAIAERHHADPRLLERLNPSSRFAAGDRIRVPQVRQVPSVPAGKPVASPPPAPVTVTVSKIKSTLLVQDARSAIIFYAPVTSGSEHDPLPIGDWAVTQVVYNPSFFYNPDLFWDADERHAKAKIAPGPNNPVGAVWIDITKEHYGLHGTPEPGRVGYAQSHGCVRLTNWDALTLAALVGKGTPVLFRE
jgi:lipoprotein-anchoring transpeptidase ErfK/SrfK